MTAALLRLFHQAAAVLWPPHCLVCGRALRRGILCLRCRPDPSAFAVQDRCQVCFTPDQDLDACARCANCRHFPPVFERMRFLWSYEGRARALITAMKYRPSPKLCRLVGEQLCAHLDGFFPFPAWDLIVPVPSSRESFRRRCFNQCLVMARSLRRACPAAALDAAALRHLGCRHAQASLPHARRIENVRHAFRAQGARLQSASVLLVDDVITTGATATAAAAALLRAGAARVDLLAAARAPGWQAHRAEIYKELP